MGRIGKRSKSKQGIKNKTKPLNKDHVDEEVNDEPVNTAQEDAYDSADKENDSSYEANGDQKKKVKREEDTDGEVEFDAEGELDYNTPYIKELNKRLTRKRSSGNPRANLESSEDEAHDNGEEKRGKKRGRPSKKTMRLNGNKKIEPESEEEEDEGKNNSKKQNKKTPTKKTQVQKESVNKKDKKPKLSRKLNNTTKTKAAHDSDDESETDGKNYEVKKILEMHTRKDGSREFLVRWEGYKPSEDTWEPEVHLDCPQLIEKFMTKVDKAKNATVKELREPHKPKFIPSLKTNKPGGRNLRNTGVRPYYQE